MKQCSSISFFGMLFLKKVYRMARHYRHKTVKRDHKKALGIPELRKSMEYISSYSQDLVKQGQKSSKQLASEFQKEWKSVFGKSLSTKTAMSYIESIKRLSKKTTRKQRGGMAPVSYLTRPGTDIPYGNYPTYVSSGFWNPEPAILQDCGKQTGDLPAPGLGSNRISGGGIIDSATNLVNIFSTRPFLATNPESIQYSAMMNYKGAAPGPGPDAWQPAWKSHIGSNNDLQKPIVNV